MARLFGDLAKKYDPDRAAIMPAWLSRPLRALCLLLAQLSRSI